jgi:hypothetical protein
MKWRFNKHLWEASSNKRIFSKFHRALRKYGADCWNSKVLFQCLTPADGYNAEVLLIAEYDTLNEGYNTTPGGDAGPVMCGADNPMWGKTHTAEVRARLAAGARARYTGKTYEQRHGVELAAILKQKRSEDMKSIRKTRPGVGAANPNFNPEVLIFQHTSGLTFTGTRQDFHITHDISRPSITAIVTGNHARKGWVI